MMTKSNFDGLFEVYDEIFFFDTETTGLDHTIDKIIELAILRVKGKSSKSRSIDEFDVFIKQDISLPKIITDITGITDTELNEKGISRFSAAEKAFEFFGNKRKLLVAHNANFDLNFLSSLFRCDQKLFDWDKTDVIDTLTIFKDRHSYPHKLSDAVKAYELKDSVKKYHRAIDDSKATFLVFCAMCEENNDIQKYVNLFGYNPKYELHKNEDDKRIKYIGQEYNPKIKLYNLCHR